MSSPEAYTLPTVEQYIFAVNSLENMGFDGVEVFENELLLDLYEKFLEIAQVRYPSVDNDSKQQDSQEEM